MDNLALFQNLVLVAAADGKFTEEEVNFLAIRAEQWGIPNDEFDTALAGVNHGLTLQLPDKKEDRIEVMKQLIQIMAIDGELAEVEKRICAVAAARMDLNQDEFALIVDSLLRESEF